MGSPYFAIAQYGLCIALSRPLGSIRAFVALSRPLGSIRALCRPISLSLHTGSCRPISLSLNTGSVSPYLARWAQYGLCVALSRPLGSIRALVIPGLRYAHPGLYSGAPSGRSLHPGQIDNARTAGVSPHRKINNARTAGISPHRQINHARTAGAISPSPNFSHLP